MAYQKAADHAADLGQQVAEKRERLDRLRASEDQRHKKETDRLDRLLADAELAEVEADIALHEETHKSTEKSIADAEATANRIDLPFYKGVLQRSENTLRSLLSKRATVLEKLRSA